MGSPRRKNKLANPSLRRTESRPLLLVLDDAGNRHNAENMNSTFIRNEVVISGSLAKAGGNILSLKGVCGGNLMMSSKNFNKERKDKHGIGSTEPEATLRGPPFQILSQANKLNEQLTLRRQWFGLVEDRMVTDSTAKILCISQEFSYLRILSQRFVLAGFRSILLPLITQSHYDLMHDNNTLVDSAETLDETLVANDEMDVAVRAEGASFTWDSPPLRPEDPKKKSKCNKMGMKRGKPMPKPSTSFMDIDMEIPQGQLVVIVGAVEMGKTSLLQGLIGEMRRISGKVEFWWNTTIRYNICFGRPFDEERYWKAVRDACLEPDLEMLAKL
ncbi:hypothetical protein K503DRAFT_779744 [Rhizopogon vinicolor AM-OR11-026]|uniref:ABC transporter domain-containing protein n=1 Tax=Rhizopogon vinicolor AM-OR11-026 TaxID=1314800 RepID=A0A1B7ND20_9AGAM|nr:hypothetical protein K503DRAFT_779744 [Rhizopogon vinicolor AM-OR11-026]